MSATDDPAFYCRGRACLNDGCSPLHCRATDGDGRYPGPPELCPVCGGDLALHTMEPAVYQGQVVGELYVCPVPS